MLAIVILGYRARPSLEAGSYASILRAARQVSDRSVHLVYLDNYSRDGSIQWLRQNAPEADVLLAPTNSGYVRGTNSLLQYAARRHAPEHFVLVDADQFVEPSCFASLLDFARRHPRHGLVQPLVRGRRDRGRIYSAGHRYTDDHWCLPMTEIPGASACHDLPSCSIAATLVSADVLRACGLLRPAFDMYYESSDLGFRARERGFLCGCDTTAVAYNDGTYEQGPDTMHAYYYFNRNRLLFWRLHDPAIYATVRDRARPRLAELEQALAASAYGLDPAAESERRGLADGLRLAESDEIDRDCPPLDGYTKTDAVLLQDGAPIIGAK